MHTKREVETRNWNDDSNVWFADYSTLLWIGHDWTTVVLTMQVSGMIINPHYNRQSSWSDMTAATGWMQPAVSSWNNPTDPVYYMFAITKMIWIAHQRKLEWNKSELWMISIQLPHEFDTFSLNDQRPKPTTKWSQAIQPLGDQPGTTDTRCTIVNDDHLRLPPLWFPPLHKELIKVFRHQGRSFLLQHLRVRSAAAMWGTPPVSYWFTMFLYTLTYAKTC